MSGCVPWRTSFPGERNKSRVVSYNGLRAGSMGACQITAALVASVQARRGLPHAGSQVGRRCQHDGSCSPVFVTRRRRSGRCSAVVSDAYRRWLLLSACGSRCARTGRRDLEPPDAPAPRILRRRRVAAEFPLHKFGRRSHRRNKYRVGSAKQSTQRAGAFLPTHHQCSRSRMCTFTSAVDERPQSPDS